VARARCPCAVRSARRAFQDADDAAERTGDDDGRQAMADLQAAADEAREQFGDALKAWSNQDHIREHDEQLRNAWRTPPTAPRVDPHAEQHADQRPSPGFTANPTDDEIAAGQARVAAAYEEADAELREAWRG
jgi:acyl-homoserine lactone acylase PvdQ